MTFSTVKVWRFGVYLGGSGLSFGLFTVLPFWGLVLKFGRVFILSIFGLMYGPKAEGSVFM